MTQNQALEILKLGKNVFLTGAAGSGKTYVLNQYISFLKKSGIRVAVTATTGIAATHLGGMTIHSWSGIGINESLSPHDLKQLLKRSKLRNRFEQTSVLIIDEVSMLHAYQFDLVDQVARAFRDSNEPFGGLQVVLSGDLFQLPPISRDTQAQNIISSDVWQKMQPQLCYLDEQHRQSGDELTTVLNAIRSSAFDDSIYEILNSRLLVNFKESIKATKLYTHNIDVDRINQAELMRLSTKSQVYEMSARGPKKLIETLLKGCLTTDYLELKQGAVVMFVKNNYDRGYVNGTLGTVIGFDKDDGYPLVETHNGETIVATPESWGYEEDGEIRAEITQVPLRLAWAITIHKSQGMTLDAAEIDLSKSFEPGMGYVALSRLRSLQGLRLLGLNDMALLVNPDMTEIDVQLRQASEIALERLEALPAEDKIQLQELFIKVNAQQQPVIEEKISTLDKTKSFLEQKMPLAAIAETRGLTTGTIISHLERLQERGDALDLNYLRPNDETRLRKIIAAFKAEVDTTLSPVRDRLGSDYSFDEIRLGRLFLKE